MTISLQELFDNGCHLGHQAQKWHPKMKPWIYGEQDGIHLFDLEKTAAQVQKAVERVQELREKGLSVVVVATKNQAAELVEDLAEQTETMYIVNRWPGGLITNWDQVKKSIRRMNEIEDGLASDKYKEYTKYERMLLEKELNRLKRLFGGLKNLKSKPDALFVVDAMKEKNAVNEAMKEDIEVIALIDSNTDPTGVTLPIPGNDDAISSIKLIVTEVLLGKSTKEPKTEESAEVEQAEKVEDEPEKLPEAVVPVEKTVKNDAELAKEAVKEKKSVEKEEKPAKVEVKAVAPVKKVAKKTAKASKK